MSRAARYALWIAGGFLIGIGITVLALVVLTRTEWGLERARRFAIGWLEDRVNGELNIGRLSGRSLLAGVTVHDLSIDDPQGRPFVSADSVAAYYSWRNLIRGEIVFDSVTLHAPRLYMEQLAGDTLWNYEHIFADTTPDEPDGARRLIAFEDARIVDGLVVVRRPWEPDGPVEPDDTARLILEDAPGGLLQVWRFEDVNGELDRVIWESPLEEGKLFAARTLSTRAFLWKDPALLRDARGTLTLVDSIVSFEFPELELPSTRAAAIGRIIIRERNRYDVRIESDDIQFADLQWLYPPLPEDAKGSMVMRIQTQQPKGTLFLAEDANIEAPGTHMVGTLGIVLGDTLYFTRVDLRASPLDVDFLERVLPGELPVEGLLVGTVEVEGPISALDTRGSLRLTTGPASGSAVRWDGILDLRGGARGFATRRLTTELDGVDLSLLSAIRPDFPIDGVIDGRLEASGRLDRGLRLDGNLRHQAAGRPASTLEGGGTLELSNGEATLDIELDAAALALEEIGARVPALAGLHGVARGAVRLRGPLEQLGLVADLETPAGGIGFETRLTLGGERGGIAASGHLDDFRLRALSDSLPDATLAGRFGIDLLGNDLASMRGAVRLDLDGSELVGLPIERAVFRGSLDRGLLRIDTLTAVAPGIDVRAHGELGLVVGRMGELVIEAASASLEPLEPVLFDEIVDPTTPRLAGAARARGTVSGNPARLGFDAEVILDDLVYGGGTISGASVSVEGERSDAGLRLTALARADTMRIGGRSADSVTVHVDRDGGISAATVRAWRSGTPLIVASGTASPVEDEIAVRITELTIGSEGAAAADGPDGGSAGQGSRSAWSLADTAVLTFGPLGVNVSSFTLRSATAGAALRAAGTLAWLDTVPAPDPAPLPLDFTIDVDRVPVGDAMRLFRDGIDAGGVMNGRIRIAGDARAPEIDGHIAVEQLRFENANLDEVDVRFDYGDAQLDAQLEGLHGGRRVVRADGRIPLDLRFASGVERRRDAPLAMRIEADSLPAGLALAVFDGFRDVHGVIDGTVAVDGSALEPTFGGGFALREGQLTWDALGVRYRDVAGTFRVDSGPAVAVDFSARSADPRTGSDVGRGARVTGTIDLSTASDPGLDLTIDADHLLAARRRDVEMIVSGTASIGGNYRAPEVSGNVHVDGGTLYLDEIYRQYLVVGLEDPLLFQVVDTSLVSVRQILPASENPFLRNLVVRDANVTLGPDSRLRSREMNVEVRGDLTVGFNRQEEDISLAGTLEVVRGTYRFEYQPVDQLSLISFTRMFDVREGTVEFPGTPGIDPNLDITAAYRARTQNGEPLEILAQLTGTLQNPRVRLTSDTEPPYSESDLASYLLFGTPTYAFGVTRPGSADAAGESDGFGSPVLAAAARAAGVGYVAGGLQAIAQTYGLVDYIGLTTGHTTATSGGLFGNTALELGRYLTPSTYVAWSSPLRSPGRIAGFRLEWRFHPNYRLETFAEDRFGRTPFGLSSAIDPRTVLGFFLFREWDY